MNECLPFPDDGKGEASCVKGRADLRGSASSSPFHSWTGGRRCVGTLAIKGARGGFLNRARILLRSSRNDCLD
ncbi:hypothetical protein HMPREF0762_01161 [Slackia exigua ATCC 700122]|uniref:Uncharacterized protein n=1 Tax=Slackia exigua (strain ATCC 700122 / DSM 15923 / CIP 105133 / JCM 11022 / KCTC 5966 / S-7) TaxID=649764 RepID=D0WHC9_SLAES|nr:hypothetical protein HMPREF0762_01161 [Slackia exigua ATCC 700122]